MHKGNIESLLEKYNDGSATAEERALVETWYLRYKTSEHNLSGIQLEEDKQQSLDHLLTYIEQQRYARLWPRIIAAAACILVVIGAYLYVNSPKTGNNDIAYHNDVPPGHHKAILTLASGEQIGLSEAKKGIIIANDKLSYDDGSVVAEHSDLYRADEHAGIMNTIATPRGGIYEAILPDGTKVWLNAASSLKFPSTFNGADRRVVELKGEAYFDVAKARLPFIVKTTKQEVTVFGTHFNINSYDDEPVTKTTLFEGSVRVTVLQPENTPGTGDKSVKYAFLKRGQQSVVLDESLSINHPDMDVEIAWKNGDLNLKSGDFKSTMRKIARWYNVEIVYAASAPKDLILGGWVSRSKNISAVLKVMELTGKVHFKIEGRRITVTK